MAEAQKTHWPDHHTLADDRKKSFNNKQFANVTLHKHYIPAGFILLSPRWTPCLQESLKTYQPTQLILVQQANPAFLDVYFKLFLMSVHTKGSEWPDIFGLFAPDSAFSVLLNCWQNVVIAFCKQSNVGCPWSVCRVQIVCGHPLRHSGTTYVSSVQRTWMHQPCIWTEWIYLRDWHSNNWLSLFWGIYQ